MIVTHPSAIDLKSPIIGILAACMIAAAMVCPGLVRAESEQGLVQVVTDPGPYARVVEGRPEGVFVDLVEAMMSAADLPDYQLNVVPWARAYNLALNQPNTMILPLARTPEREDHFKWAGMIMPIRFYLVRLSRASHIRIRSFDDARPLNIGVFRDDVSQQFLKDKGMENLSAVSTSEIMLRMLDTGRVDLVCTTPGRLAHTCRKINKPIEEYTLEWELTDLALHLYAAFGLKTDDDLVLSVEKGMKKIREKGIYDRIMKQVLTPVPKSEAAP